MKDIAPHDGHTDGRRQHGQEEDGAKERLQPGVDALDQHGQRQRDGQIEGHNQEGEEHRRFQAVVKLAHQQWRVVREIEHGREILQADERVVAAQPQQRPAGPARAVVEEGQREAPDQWEQGPECHVEDQRDDGPHKEAALGLIVVLFSTDETISGRMVGGSPGLRCRCRSCVCWRAPAR